MQNDVGVIVAEKLRVNKLRLRLVIEIDCVFDRLMSIKIDIGSMILIVVTCYAPQKGCLNEEMECGLQMDGNIAINGQELTKSTQFKYLGLNGMR